jgi:hypothetical protein
VFKGIVSRDLEVYFLASFDRSEVANGACSFAFKILTLFQIFRFSHLAVVSLLCELI